MSSSDFTVFRGTLTAVNVVEIQPPFASELLTLEPGGTVVEKGQLIGTLAPGDRPTELKLAKIALHETDLKLQKAQTKKKFAKQIFDLTESKARLNKLYAQKKHKQSILKRKNEKIIEAQENIRLHLFAQKVYSLNVEALTRLNLKGYSSQLRLLNAMRDLKTSEIELEFANKILPWLKETYDKKETFTSLQNLKSASESLQLAKITTNTELKLRHNEIDSLLLDQQIRKNRANELGKQIESLSIIAPTSGILLRSQVDNGQETIAPGDQVYPGSAFASIVDLRKLGVNFRIDQSDYFRIDIDSIIYFRPDASQEFLIKGQITKISPIAHSRFNRQDSDRLFDVTAVLSDCPVDFRPGLNGTIYIADCAMRPEKFFLNNTTVRSQTRSAARSISLPGTIVASERTLVNTPYQAKLSWLAEEGNQVNKGDTIARIDKSEVQKKHDELASQLISKNEELSLNEQQAIIAVNKQILKVNIAAGESEVAQLEHYLFVNRRNEDEINRLKQQSDLLNSRLKLKQEELKLEKDLLNRGLKSELDIMNVELELIRLEKQANVNQFSLKQKKAGPTELSIKMSEIKVKLAKLKLKKAELNKTKMQKINKYDRHLLQSEIDSIQQQLKLERSKLERSEIRATRQGIVTMPSARIAGTTRSARIGDRIGQQTIFMHIADITSLEISLQISEVDIGFIELGQLVKINLPSAPGRTFSGWVDSISPVAENNPGRRPEAVFETTVALTSSESGQNEIDPVFRPGASCEVQIELYSFDSIKTISYDSIIPTTKGPMTRCVRQKLTPISISFSDGLNGYFISDSLSDNTGEK